LNRPQIRLGALFTLPHHSTGAKFGYIGLIPVKNGENPGFSR
jgi:hypothetical protein